MLTIAGFFARLYMAHVDPFLHIWDERFHALVARNMIDAPFTPILRTFVLFPADYTQWTQAHIWLHKQPLFMWQMAASMKLFGATEYVLRYPSVVMGTLMIPMVYRIAKDLSNNPKISLITAALFCFSCFHLELVAGIRSMDHNDLAFQFYLTGSVWSWLRYSRTAKWQWALAAGFFAGGAILVKWLVGLFVFLLWATDLLFKLKKGRWLGQLVPFGLALLVCTCVFLPWQLYILHLFPQEAAFEYAFNTKHITEALEGHTGTVFFYLERFPQLFGEGVFLLLFPGIWFFLRSKGAVQQPAIMAGYLFVFLFFSLVVNTKVVSHIFFLAPFSFLFIAYSVDWINSLIKPRFMTALLAVILFVLVCKPEKIIADQSALNDDRNRDIARATSYKNLSALIPPDITVVANVSDCISLMFYNKWLVAYEGFTPEQLELLAARKIKIAVLPDSDEIKMSNALSKYPFLFKVAKGSFDRY